MVHLGLMSVRLQPWYEKEHGGRSVCSSFLTGSKGEKHVQGMRSVVSVSVN